jgi:hypothetical protein
LISEPKLTGVSAMSDVLSLPRDCSRMPGQTFPFLALEDPIVASPMTASPGARDKRELAVAVVFQECADGLLIPLQRAHWAIGTLRRPWPAKSITWPH